MATALNPYEQRLVRDISKLCHKQVMDYLDDELSFRPAERHLVAKKLEAAVKSRLKKLLLTGK